MNTTINKLSFPIIDYKPTGTPFPTLALFYEKTYYGSERKPELCKFTLSDEDKEIDGTTYLSLKKIYLEIEDLTEYEFATKVFNSFPLWENLTGVKWFKPIIAQWRKELQLKIKAKVLKDMMSNIRTKKGDINFSVSKYLAEYQINPHTKKKEREAEKEELAKVIKEDLNRLSLGQIN